MPENIGHLSGMVKNGTSQGFVANQFMTHGFNAAALRTNDLLRKLEWESFDEVLVEIARDRLVVAGDLMSRGLTHNVPNAMGKMILSWEDSSIMEPAIRSMEGITPARSDRIEFDSNSIPLYITHHDFWISLRTLTASRTLGEALDTAQVTEATIQVTESIEDAVLNGAGLTVGGFQAFGYTTHPNRNTGTYEATGGAWDSGTKTGAQILADVLSMISALHVDNMFGPYVLYIPALYWAPLMEDFKAESDKTIMSRLLEIPTLETIRVGDKIPVNASIMVQLTRNVVDMVVGEQVQNVQWDSHGGFLTNFKVLSIMVPRIKRTQSLQSGIVHFIPA